MKEMFDDTYLPIFNPTSNKFRYKKDPKRAKYAECPTCKIRVYHKQAIDLVKCNSCGYARPETPNKTITVKKRCQICGKKRKIKEYVIKGKTALICTTCMKGSE
jgi:Zn ribbon nucleic-acid-binding protein